MTGTKGWPRHVGVLGGMGPDATVYFFDRLVRHTPAAKDQEHLPVTILNWPHIPDRTAAVYDGGADPVPLAQKGIDQLADAGCKVIAIPCVSIHYFLDRMKIPAGIQLVNILEATAAYTRHRHPEVRGVGVLGTDLTVFEKLFHPAFSRHAVKVMAPSPEDQAGVVMKAIYQVKAGMRKEPGQLLMEVVERLAAAGSEAIISGCTEVPIVIQSGDISLPFIDCLDCLAEAVVRQALAGPGALTSLSETAS